ncbi:MAG TPA: alpha/beta hydrolase-fold protein [Candidatus Wallbacteria bacterium]|nr:alpha/beta hydrolase-fold protein [Candidatus Wallbacteria bacterium]
MKNISIIKIIAAAVISFLFLSPFAAFGQSSNAGSLITNDSRAADNFIITVKIPQSTPAGDKIYISGGHEKMGNWKGAGAELVKISEFTYRFGARLEKDCEIEFKFTRGDFSKVEKDFKGHEIPNRKLFFNFEAGENKIDCAVEAWADIGGASGNASPGTPQITGDFDFIKNFKSKILGNERDIIVLLPPSYKYETGRKKSLKRYPVLYMHDGNNLFDPNTSFQGVDWSVDEACDKLYKESSINEMIVVAVYNTSERMSEYTPFKDPVHGGGDGDKYLGFLIEELMPHINLKYRTLTDAKNTAIGGSSLGGLISLYACAKRSDKFSRTIVMSPSIWWAGGKIIDFVASARLDDSKTKIWLDMGRAEGEEGLSYARRFNSEFNKKYPGFKSYCYKEFPDAPHNETAWRARITLPLKYMFAKIK